MVLRRALRSPRLSHRLPMYLQRTLAAPTVPSWMGAVNEWAEVPNSSFSGSSVLWTGTSPGAANSVNGPATNVITAWSGAVLAQDGVYRGGVYVNGPHLCPWGGGHNNYGGNEMYALGPLTSETPSWARMMDPTIPGPTPPRDGSGYPASRHTYDTIQYLAGSKKMLAYGAPATYPIGDGYTAGQLFDFTVDPTAVNPWTQIDAQIIPSPAGPGFLKWRSAVDEITGNVWGIGQGNGAILIRYNPGTNTTHSWGIDNNNDVDVKAAFAGSLGLLVFAGPTGMCAVDVRAAPATSGGWAPTVYSISIASGTPPSMNAMALEWDAVGNRFLAWNDSGKTLYVLTPSSNPYNGGAGWTWTGITPAGGATPGTTFFSNTVGFGRNVFGRFRIFRGPTWRGLVLMPNETTPVCVFRLS